MEKGSYRATMRALVAAVFFTYVAQNMLNVSIAPLARELHLVEWAIGLAVSLAALFVTAFSQAWGRRSVAWGPRKVMIASLLLALCAGLLFAGAVAARAAGMIGAAAATIAIIAARGPFFGTAISAVPPTAQAIIARATPSESERIKGMANYSGAVNISIMVGSLFSSAVGAWWIFGPVYATSVFIAIALVIAWWMLPSASQLNLSNVSEESRQPPVDEGELPPKVSFFDPRILPWIISIFGVFFTGGVVQIIAGFIVQDRFHTTPQGAMPLTGALLLAIAGGAMVMQLLIVPRLGFTPRTLVLIGVAMDIVCLFALFIAPTVLACVLSCIGIGAAGGMAGVGFNAGGTLAVSEIEIGGVAGVLNAAGAITWIFAPVSATALYGSHPAWPFTLCAALLAISFVTVCLHPRMKKQKSAA